jgi:hypothetical protein
MTKKEEKQLDRANQTKWRAISDEEIEVEITAAKISYDPETSRKIIEYFYERIRDGAHFNRLALQNFVFEAFRRIVEESKNPDQAFGISPGRGNYDRKIAGERDIEIAAYVRLLVRHGWTSNAAIGEAANSFFPDGEGDKAVQGACAIFKEVLDDIEHLPNHEKVLRELSSALIPDELPQAPLRARRKTSR